MSQKLSMAWILVVAWFLTANHAVEAQIKPAPIDGKTVTINFPEPAKDICVGGAGQYLILHFPGDKKLAVFDINQIKIVTDVAVTDTIVFAAGLDKLFVTDTESGELTRYSLPALKKEATGRIPAALIRGKVTTAMGCASKGPLLLGLNRDVYFMDTETLKRTMLTWDKEGFGNDSAELRVSANGQVFTAFRAGSSPDMLCIYRITGKKIERYNCSTARGPLYPSPNGAYMFGTDKIFTGFAKPVGDPIEAGKTIWYFPAVQGNYFLSLSTPERHNIAIGIHARTDQEPALVMPPVEGINKLVDWNVGRPARLDKHLFLIADAQVLAFVPASQDRIVLYWVDVSKIK